MSAPSLERTQPSLPAAAGPTNADPQGGQLGSRVEGAPYTMSDDTAQRADGYQPAVSAPSASVPTEECLGKPARYWYDAFQIAEGLRADAERRVTELQAARSAMGDSWKIVNQNPTDKDPEVGRGTVEWHEDVPIAVWWNDGNRVLRFEIPDPRRASPDRTGAEHG